MAFLACILQCFNHLLLKMWQMLLLRFSFLFWLFFLLLIMILCLFLFILWRIIVHWLLMWNFLTFFWFFIQIFEIFCQFGKTGNQLWLILVCLLFRWAISLILFELTGFSIDTTISLLFCCAHFEHFMSYFRRFLWNSLLLFYSQRRFRL